MISVIDCLWNGIATSQDLKTFTQLEGIDLLLDILEICPATVIKNQILSMLIHVSSTFPEIMQSLLNWESDKTQIRIHRLLISLWCNEEARLGSNYGSISFTNSILVLTDNGILTDPDRPLTNSYHVTRKPKTALTLNKEAVDMRVICKATSTN
jgi:hypothetical protein